MSARLWLQYALPHRALSRLVRWATRWTWRPWKDFLIGAVVRRFDVAMAEAAEPSPRAYPHFNAFFTRALKPGARRAEPDPAALLCPADGRISQAGRIEAGRIFQAKGRSFTATELLADAEAAAPFRDGHFVTVYLSPRDYHRVHMPLAGELLETVHVPGRLFSVAPFAVEGVPRLFARNERLVCHFRGERGPFAVVMVGALLVSGVATVWGGAEIPPYASRIVRKDWRGKGVRLERFAEMARFEMGSTVIVLLPADGGTLAPGLAPERPVRVGERLGTL
ncbi:MAG: archaetidylserine decarboxylase [Mizugakiibacter sp.]|uniref:archaetidylserine decarboxylase n=1 Tax=Mizugakiibacter sp. TaxID=1972610 RepID=UPI0031C30D1B|nr:archaetidylserine decarboxylase [Xanthomonadaceae bacterium]